MWAWVIGLCVAVLIATYMIFVEPPPPRTLVMASGSRDGAYFRHARRYAEELRKVGLTLDVRETAGSVENLRRLGQGEASVAIVQSGVAGAEDLKGLRALGSLYHEPLWVFHRGEPIDRLGQLAGKRVGVGPRGSGTHAVALQLLAANGLVESEESARVTLVSRTVAEAARALRKGELDAAFFVAAFETESIQGLLRDPEIRLLDFKQQEAYHRRFRFLAPVTIPEGMVDFGLDLPSRDVALLAPTAMLVARDDLHPALVPLLLTAARRIHGGGDEVSAPGDFPSLAFCDFPVSEEARHFYRSGPPVLQRLLPFWLASLVDRAKVMLIPILMLMMPLLRATPPLMRWRTRRKIYLWYSDLREIDQTLVAGASPAELDEELGRLREIEGQVARVDVPLSYMEEFYHLRMHMTMLKQHLAELMNGIESPPDARR